MTTWVSKNDNFKGHFNLSTKGHGKCLEHMMKFGLPIILLGGGGYNIPNVARCWAYETGLCCGHKIEGKIPKTEMFYDLYAPDYKVHVTMDKNFPNKKNSSIYEPNNSNSKGSSTHRSNMDDRSL